MNHYVEEGCALTTRTGLKGPHQEVKFDDISEIKDDAKEMMQTHLDNKKVYKATEPRDSQAEIAKAKKAKSLKDNVDQEKRFKEALAKAKKSTEEADKAKEEAGKAKVAAEDAIAGVDVSIAQAVQEINGELSDSKDEIAVLESKLNDALDASVDVVKAKEEVETKLEVALDTSGKAVAALATEIEAKDTALKSLKEAETEIAALKKAAKK